MIASAISLFLEWTYLRCFAPIPQVDFGYSCQIEKDLCSNLEQEESREENLECCKVGAVRHATSLTKAQSDRVR